MKTLNLVECHHVAGGTDSDETLAVLMMTGAMVGGATGLVVGASAFPSSLAIFIAGPAIGTIIGTFGFPAIAYGIYNLGNAIYKAS